MKRKRSKPVFKSYTPNQGLLFPPNLEDLIQEHHPVRVVSKVIDQLDITPLLRSYKGGGTSSYHPKMLLKVLVYAYLRNIYSSRKIEEALQENIHFMWLSGMSKPDHSTISAFRSKRLKGQIKVIFSQVVLLLAQEGLVDIQTIYTDGTKVEANANRYTFVWGKSVRRYRKRIEDRLAELWAYVEQVYQAEDKQVESITFEAISSEKAQETVAKIEAALKDKEVRESVKKKLKKVKKTDVAKLAEYEQKEALLAGRNNYSKTDTDATFMRTKDDHMKNGQLKPCYNVQFSTSNQVVVSYTVGQSSTDTTLYQAHLEDYATQYAQMPTTVVADAGYGSEENYTFLEQEGIESYVKYSYFHQEQKKKYQLNPSKKANLHYNAEQDCYYCPMGQKMEYQYRTKKTTKTGFVQHLAIYQAKNCVGCPMRGSCHQSKENRKIYRNARLENYKARARTNLNSELGQAHRGRRCAEVEASFGQLKANKQFRRFLLRGLPKVTTEIGLVALSMNLAKLSKYYQQKLPMLTPVGVVCPDRSKNGLQAPKKASKELKKRSRA